MEPIFYHGDLLLLKKASTYQIGDIVGYKPSLPAEFNLEGKRFPLIVHRIVEIDKKGWFITKGDNFDKKDPYAIKEDVITGKLWFRIPYLGKILMFLQKPFYLALTSSLLFFFLIGIPIILKEIDKSRNKFKR